MPTVMPDGEALRNAVRWISERRQEEDAPSTAQLIDEAGRRFDLSPMEQLSLMRLLHARQPESLD